MARGAYRSRRPRRSFRAKRTTKRTTSGRRKVYRRHRPRRSYRRPRSRRNILNITSHKKRDTLESATTTDKGTTDAVADVKGPTAYFLFCPTFRQKYFELQQNKHVRATPEVYYKGYSERAFIKTKAPLIWRRIVFWSCEQFKDALPVRFQRADGQEYYSRRLIEMERSGGDFLTLQELLFRGTEGIDYQPAFRWNQPLNAQRVRITYDRSFTINPTRDVSEASDGKLSRHNFWHPGAKVKYKDIEEGLEVDESGWASSGYGSWGNMYVLDIFTEAIASTKSNPVAKVSFEGTSYWHER